MRGRNDRNERIVQQLTSQVSSMQSVMATMSTPPASGDPAAAVPVSRSITDDEEREYGSEFLDVVGRQARDAFNPEVAAIKKQMDSLQSRLNGVTGVVSADARTRMFTALDERIPAWRVTNDDPNFLSWLQLPDPYSGAIRQGLLNAAFERNDGSRVLAFFNGFLAEEAAVDPAPSVPDLAASDPLPAPKVPLADLAAPGRAKTPAGGTPPVEKPIISRAQIAQFYADVNSGKYRGRDAEKNENEQIIFSAQAEGRLR
jgi:hypothetical protein